jgi:hypothetical protein
MKNPASEAARRQAKEKIGETDRALGGKPLTAALANPHE